MKAALKIGRLSRLLRSIANVPIVLMALIWRRTALRRTTLIAITGSVGKTTAKDCLAAILSKVGPTIATTGGNNGRFGLPRLLLQGRPRHRFVVAEVGIIKPGRMWRSALLLKPDVTVITRITWQHARNFGSLDEIAGEKARLLDPLAENGLAVLNADDPRVAAMRRGRSCRVRTYGAEKPADVRGEVTAFRWPDRLALNVREGEERHLLRTQLVGSHWAVSVLGATTAARSLGASWEDCTQGLTELAPHPGRLSCVRLPSGADLLRDEYNGSFATFVQAAEVLKLARSRRRILALGHILDAPDLGDQGPEEVGRRAAQTADLLLLWGAYAQRYHQAALAEGFPPDRAYVFQEQRELAEFLKREATSGDLVLLKGFWFDHMTRVVFEQFGTVSCRLTYCEIPSVCDPCRRLGFRLDPAIRDGLDTSLTEGLKRLGSR